MSELWRGGMAMRCQVRGEGLPFLFLHGLGGSSTQGLGLLDPLEGVCQILPDLRGHGETELGPVEELSFSAMAEDVAALWRSRGLGRVVLGGISMGAAVAVAAALRFPDQVERLVLLRPAWTDAPMAERVRAWYRALAAALRKGSPAALEADPAFREIRTHEDTAAIFLNAFQDRASLRWPEKYELLPAQRPLGALAELGRLELPALILADRGDPIHPFSYAERYAAALPHSTLLEVPSKGTEYLAYRTAVNRALRNFLSDGRRPGGPEEVM